MRERGREGQRERGETYFWRDRGEREREREIEREKERARERSNTDDCEGEINARMKTIYLSRRYQK